VVYCKKDQYLTYSEYTAMGGTLSEAEFNLAEFRCRKRIDRQTFDRIHGMKRVPKAVKLCMMSLIGIDSKVGAEAQVNAPVVTSFNTDGYSESYGKALGVEDAEKTMTSSIRSMLWGEKNDQGVPLLYRGCEC